MSRIQASLFGSACTSTDAGNAARARASWRGEAPTRTGSHVAIAEASWTKAACAGAARSRQMSGRSGQIIQVAACGSNSPGMRQPSAAGVLVSVRGSERAIPLC